MDKHYEDALDDLAIGNRALDNVKKKINIGILAANDVEIKIAELHFMSAQINATLFAATKEW